MEIVVLRSSDCEIFQVNEHVAVQSLIIKNVIEDVGADSVIPLPNVTSSVLRKVIEYCTKHVESDVDTRAVDDALKAWDAEFVKVDQNTLFDLVLAANFLNIESLNDLTCWAVANMIKGKTVKELREILNVKSDFTPEEEEEIQREERREIRREIRREEIRREEIRREMEIQREEEIRRENELDFREWDFSLPNYDLTGFFEDEE